MGCCNSREAEEGPETTSRPNSGGLDTHHQTSSTHAITSSAAPPSTTARGVGRSLRAQPSLTTTSSTPRASTHAPDLSEQPNAPLRQHPPWLSKKRLWTTKQLERERYEFFETRVTGNAEIWAALRTVTELMREGQLPTAQEILNAAGITVPTGDIVSGVYDQSGQLYRIPSEILRDPENLVKEEDENRNTVHEAKENILGIEGMEVDEEDEDAERRREEKGKGSERDMIKIKCRLSDRGGPDVLLSIGRSQNVSVLIRRIQTESGMPRSQRVRIAYLGKILKEEQTLDAQGWREGHVVNALVSPNVDAQSNNSAKSAGG